MPTIKKEDRIIPKLRSDFSHEETKKVAKKL